MGRPAGRSGRVQELRKISGSGRVGSQNLDLRATLAQSSVMCGNMNAMIVITQLVEHKHKHCDVYVGGKVRVSEFMIFLDLQHCGSK